MILKTEFLIVTSPWLSIEILPSLKAFVNHAGFKLEVQELTKDHFTDVLPLPSTRALILAVVSSLDKMLQ
jgi:hypothetical protein